LRLLCDVACIWYQWIRLVHWSVTYTSGGGAVLTSISDVWYWIIIYSPYSSSTNQQNQDISESFNIYDKLCVGNPYHFLHSFFQLFERHVSTNIGHHQAVWRVSWAIVLYFTINTSTY
jgi:hypothetical protein